LYKNGQKLYKSAHNSYVFGRFSTVQQYPESVFTPINTDSPPGSARKFHQIPVFHIPDQGHPFIISCPASLSRTFTFSILHFSPSSASGGPNKPLRLFPKTTPPTPNKISHPVFFHANLPKWHTSRRLFKTVTAYIPTSYTFHTFWHTLCYSIYMKLEI
jgi:hypothetical protein